MAFAKGMGELVFIGLGLHNGKGMTLRGLEEARASDVVFAEFYTSTLAGGPIRSIEDMLGKTIHVLPREDVEKGDSILEAASKGRVAFLVAGDPMAATTHVDLRLRARAAGISTRIVPGVSILTAAAGALGLQSYKFGRTTTVPFPAPGFRPTSPLEVITANRRAGLHTLVLLDLKDDGSFLDPKAALEQLLDAAEATGHKEFDPDGLACVLSRVGSPEALARAGRIRGLLAMDLGPSPHCLVIPGSLHFLEREALEAFAGLPQDR